MSGPWSNTVEAADSDELQSARQWAVALEQRLAEVSDFLDSCGCSATSDRSCPGCRVLRLIASELTA